MQIILDGKNDVIEFLELLGARLSRADVVVAQQAAIDAIDFYANAGFPGALPPDEAQTPEQALRNDGSAPENPRADGSYGYPQGEQQPAAEQPQKRKRRTKAEMQADAERETGLQQPGTLPEGQGTEPGSSTPETASNAAVQAALAGDAVGAAAALANVPLGDSPFATPGNGNTIVAQVTPQPAGKLPPVAKPQGPEETRAWIEMTAVGKFNAITPVDHMNLAKNFIAGNGMNGYNESFGLVGLSNNIMGFTQEQRALHAAALDLLDWA